MRTSRQFIEELRKELESRERETTRFLWSRTYILKQKGQAVCFFRMIERTDSTLTFALNKKGNHETLTGMIFVPEGEEREVCGFDWQGQKAFLTADHYIERGYKGRRPEGQEPQLLIGDEWVDFSKMNEAIQRMDERFLKGITKEEKMIVYVDLDNTLVDFMSGVRKCSAEEVEKYGKTDDLDDIPDVFAKMEPIEGAIEGFQFLAKHFDTYILSTAPWNNPSAWCDKLEWVKKHLGDAAYKRLILTHHKDLNRGDYLIDDSVKNGVAEFRGTHIHFGSPDFPNWKAVTEFFKSFIDEKA